MENLQPPKPLQITSGEGAENRKAWQRWREAFEIYLIASGASEKSEKVKRACLLFAIGEEGRRIKKTMTGIVEEGDHETSCDALLEKFEEHFVEKTNQTFERHLFKCIKQNGRKFNEFITELREQAAKCSFQDKMDENIIDQIIFGLDSDELRRKLFDVSGVDTLDTVVNKCRKWELLQEQLNVMQNKSTTDETESMHAIGRGRAPFRGSGRGRRGSSSAGSRVPSASVQTFQQTQSADVQQNQSGQNTRLKCYRCNTHHPRGQCLAWGKRCAKCHGMGHFAVCCKTRVVHNVGNDDEMSTGASVSQESGFQNMYGDMSNSSQDADQYEEYFVAAVEGNNMSKRHEWYAMCNMGDKMQKVNFKLDTGSMVNIIPKSVYSQVTQKTLRPSRRPLTAYNNQPINVLGELVLPIMSASTKVSHLLNFIVVDQESVPILGVEACEQMGLVKKTCHVSQDGQLHDEYRDVFDAPLSGLNTPPVHINIRNDSEGEQIPPRRIPFALLNKVQVELERMEKEGVISKVDTATKFVSPMVLVEKQSGELRICLDPQALNDCILSDKHVMPTVEELTARLSGSKYFATLDARAGFWQVKLDEESSFLTTFSTPFGNYKFNRLPFGLNISTQVFQKIVGDFFKDTPGVELYVDDILIHAPDEATLQQRLRVVLDVCREKNLRLNWRKCVLKKTEIKYLGFIISSDGIKVDPSKVESIVEFDTPKTKEQVQEFLGMLTYVGKFIQNLSEETYLLRSLLKKDTEFVWTENHAQVFNRLKQIMVQAPVLRFFDPNKQSTITCDASKHGLGASLMQEGHLVACASRSLTLTEQNYAQIEKELLSVVFATSRFHQYVYGTHFVVENDHKPLKFILKKPLAVCPPRIQRLMLRLQRYDFQYNWTPGKELLLADALSRNPQNILSEEDICLQQELECQVHMVTSSLPFTETTRAKFRQAVQDEPIFQSLTKLIVNGWPDSCEVLSENLKPYWNFREELSMFDGLVFKGERVLVPGLFQKEMLSRVHEGHLGIDKCIARAKSCMFWVGITNQIKQLCGECEICQSHQNRQQKEPLISHERPDIPWHKLGTDVFHFDDKNFILVVDYYSNYFEIAHLRDMSSKETIIKLKSIFARHGIPNQLVSDNGTNYVSFEFSQFCEEWGITHTTSSPKYPKANGLAESYVGIVKKLLVKAQDEGRDPYLALLNYRDAPILDGKSPAELLMGRKLRTRLPVSTASRQLSDHHTVKYARDEKLHQQQQVYNKTAKPLESLELGELVLLWSDKQNKWIPANVVEVSQNPRSYTVKTQAGEKFVRNRVDLRKTKAKFPPRHDLKLLSDLFDSQYGEGDIYQNDSESMPRQNVDRSAIPSANMSPHKQSPMSKPSPGKMESVPSDRNNLSKTDTPVKITSRGRQVKLPVKYRNDYKLEFK